MKSISIPPAVFPFLKLGFPLFALILVLLTLVRGSGRDHEVPTLKASTIGMVPSIADSEDAAEEGNSDHSAADQNRPRRWVFADRKENEREWVERQLKMGLADELASAFAVDSVKLADALSASKTEVMVDWVGKHLPKIHPDLRWEAGPNPKAGTFDFTVTCEQHRYLQPMVDMIVRKLKKKKIEGWEFWTARKPMPLPNIENMFVARNNRKPIRFKVDAKSDDDKTIALMFTSTDFTGTNSPKDLGAASALTELALGENNLNHWVGTVSSNKAKKAAKVSGSVYGDAAAFIRSFEKQKKALVAKLPEKYYWEMTPPKQQALVKFHTGSKTLSERRTLITWLPNFECAAGTRLFSSERFSKKGEQFCYLKAQGVGELVLPEKREAIETKIDSELRAAKLGCIVGAGSGTMESIYIDLCLPSAKDAIPKLRELCAQIRLPKNTTLRFYDPELRYEWVGMYAETEAPKAPEKVW